MARSAESTQTGAYTGEMLKDGCHREVESEQERTSKCGQ
jgi:hypothetical protein